MHSRFHAAMQLALNLKRTCLVGNIKKLEKDHDTFVDVSVKFFSIETTYNTYDLKIVNTSYG